MSIAKSKSSVTISISMVSSSLSESVSKLSLSKPLLSKLVQFMHSQPGPQYLPSFLQPHLLLLHPFLQVHPFIRNLILLLIYFISFLGIHSIEYVSSSYIHPLSNGNGKVLDDAGKLVNTLMHKEIERASQAFTSNKFNPSSFKLKESVEAINPMLWNFLCTITKSVREYSGKAVPPNKQIMRYFVLCQLMHCTNQQFLSPLHYILADTIEMYGGARKLIKLFNRLGIVCSTDTHDRVVMEIAENERSKQISESLISNVFTVTSVDNIDILKPHAAVYCGDQERSYHGTTIQVVQPHPLLVLSSNANTANTSICTCTYSNSSISDLHVATAATADSMVPIESATINTCSHTLEPAQLCMFTDNMSDNNESHVAIVAIFDSDLPESAALNHHPFSAQQSTSLMQPCSRSKSPLPKKRRIVSIKQPFNTRSTHLQVTTPVMHQSLSIVALDGFKENEKESSERKKIEYQYLCYMHCKEALKGVANEKILKALHQFTVEQTSVPPSNIYYMEVIDENPDSTETMKLVSEMLLDVLLSMSQTFVMTHPLFL